MKDHVAFALTQTGVCHDKLHADFNNPSIFWSISEFDSVEDLKNLFNYPRLISRMLNFYKPHKLVTFLVFNNFLAF